MGPSTCLSRQRHPPVSERLARLPSHHEYKHEPVAQSDAQSTQGASAFRKKMQQRSAGENMNAPVKVIRFDEPPFGQHGSHGRGPSLSGPGIGRSPPWPVVK
ncbi:hypothetical protein AWB67_06802 [Caballeronia terrestris]|uniref:Uncharacterized protein n=1 Tax=Caballeronia terrestris TaxID=1226301 RepID=A0A158KW18_9BURK|nr:hypothetical protein AWB67_06802 [Caballeronia terrestris]